MPDDLHDDDIRTDIKWIRKKLESQCDWQQRYEEKTDARFKDVEDDVSGLKNWRSLLTGGFVAISAVIGWILK